MVAEVMEVAGVEDLIPRSASTAFSTVGKREVIEDGRTPAEPRAATATPRPDWIVTLVPMSLSAAVVATLSASCSTEDSLIPNI